MIASGRVWSLGDGVRATDLVSAQYDRLGMSGQWGECAKHLLEELRPGLAGAMSSGDLLVGGSGFGGGHAHYYMAAVMGVRTAGFGAILVDSVNGLFQRAAIDFGLLVWDLPGISRLVAEGDVLSADLEAGRAENLSTGAALEFAPLSPIVLDILAAGGTAPWALKRVGAA
jgi:3-isopropylmalate/(R)-2-methylmalate dehydratase small subunit